MLSAQTLRACKKGIRIINVARGGLIDEPALVESLNCGHVHSVALDVFEVEPLPMTSKLHVFEKNIFGSHNASNTIDAVVKTNTKGQLASFLISWVWLHDCRCRNGYGRIGRYWYCHKIALEERGFRVIGLDLAWRRGREPYRV